MDRFDTGDFRALNRIIKIDQQLDHVKDLDLLLELLLKQAREEASADAGTIYMNENNGLKFSHTQNDTLQAKLKDNEKLPYSSFTVPINDNSITGFVGAHKTFLNIPDMYAINADCPYSFDPSFDRKTDYKTVSCLTFPLLSSDDELLGVMQLINAKNNRDECIPFQDKDVPFFALFARFAAKAIQRAQMTRNLLETISGFSGLRDPLETGAHVNRVGAYSMELYENWAMKHKVESAKREKKKDILRMAAMLHDVGKVGISDLILKKPGRLRDDEYSIIQSHTWIGARQFSDNSELSLAAKEVALCHHENWNGTGYPGKIENLNESDEKLMQDKSRPGLVGEEIPLFARIVSICDVYDALCSQRVYKKAKPKEEVINIIEMESGKKFDPELVEVFSSILPSIEQVQQRYPDHPPK